MSEPKKAIRTAELKIGNLTMTVHVLNTGERVIEEESMVKFFEWLESGEITMEDAEKFAMDLKTF